MSAASPHSYGPGRAADGVKDARAIRAAGLYDSNLAKVGRLVRIEPYAGAHTPIRHRCLVHREEHTCMPTNALKGQGLKCCKLAADHANAARKQAAAASVYDAKLAELGRLERREPYAGARTPILHRCLEHAEEQLCSPDQALRGCGLRCCKLSADRANGDRRQAEAAESYDAKLSALGKLVRLEPYLDSRTPIMHRCLYHKEEHRCTPNMALSGKGLRCCKQAADQATYTSKIAAAAASYDDKLAEIGKLERQEPYAGRHTPILHRCLLHGEEHLCSPHQTLQGCGLRCCGGLPSSLLSLIWREHGPELLESCQFYAYTVSGNSGLVKPGIARNHARRAADISSRGLYGELLAVWDMPTRREALLVEGAILRDPAILRPAEPTELLGLRGGGEVRQIDGDALVAHAQSLVDSITNHTGPWQAWALENVPKLSRAERIALRRQLAR